MPTNPGCGQVPGLTTPILVVINKVRKLRQLQQQATYSGLLKQKRETLKMLNFPFYFYEILILFLF